MIQAQIFIDEDDLHEGKPLRDFILKLLVKHKIKGATVLRAVFGFGSHHHMNQPDQLFSFDEVPLLITFIDEDEKVKQAILDLRKYYKGGLMVTHAVEKW